MEKHTFYKNFFYYLLKKLCYLVFSLLIVASLAFFLIKALPGNPFIQGGNISEETLKNLLAHHGLDKPLYLQYLQFLKNLCLFDFGPSLVFEGTKLSDIIIDNYLPSLTIGSAALVLALFGGVFLGLVSAIYHQKWQDKLALLLSLLGISLPSFLCAFFLQYLFAIKLKILPLGFFSGFSHLILPCVSLALMPGAFIFRLVRNQALETLSQNYIKTAKLKGLSKPYIIFFHVLRNSSIPVVGYFCSIASYLLAGSFAIEKIFAIPGIGSWLILSISNRDYPIVLGLVLFFSLIILIVIFIADLIYKLIDPRIKNER